MNVLSCEAFINPVLIAKLPIGSVDFSELKRQFKDEAKIQSNWEYRASGFLEVRNRSVKAIKCHGESIGPGMCALFAAAFTAHDLPFPQANYTPVISLESVLLLEQDLKCVLSSRKVSFSEGKHKKISLRPSSSTSVKKLIEQFDSYLKNKQLLEYRKKNNSEFKKYADDPGQYKNELSRMMVLSAKTKSILEY